MPQPSPNSPRSPLRPLLAPHDDTETSHALADHNQRTYAEEYRDAGGDALVEGMPNFPRPRLTSGHGHDPDAYDHIPLSLRGGGGSSSNAPEAADDDTSSPAVRSPRIQQVMRSDVPDSPQSEKKPGKGVSIAQGSPEIIDSQSVINQYKERLARDIARRELAARSSPQSPKRVSPIREEMSLSPASGSVSSSDIPTASTESNKTVRGGMTPGYTPGLAARTPSYPFPRMMTPHHFPSALSRSANNQSHFESPGLHDQLRSDPSTPASTMTFQPTGAIPPLERDFPTPNLYELALMLGAEPGLDAWWSTVVQIMKQYYRAERVTLSVPADATDLENVPWGQKATYNAMEEDEFSMEYMGRSSLFPGSMDGLSEFASNVDGSQMGDPSLRPDLQSRHSFTSYENKRESRTTQTVETPNITPRRPGVMPRSKSYFPSADRHTPGTPRPALNKQALEEHDAVEKQQEPTQTWDAPLVSRPEVKGRVLPVLQGLDLEADPLIDHNGIKGVVERGKVIALTRSYPYLESAPDERSKKKPKKPTRPEMVTKLSSFLGTGATGGKPAGMSNKKTGVDRSSKRAELLSVLNDEEPRPPTPRYEEYEQAPPSPWSQSPAPSPAVRADPSENPFFTDAMVDEDSFNPGPSPHDYTDIQPPETIGVDNSWTVLHIPLKHILLSKPAGSFKLSSAALAQKTASRGRHDVAESGFPERPTSADSLRDNRQSPIAILSILSPLIPYPSNLRYSLEHLSPHLATSFSMCRHYTNLETEVAGLQRKRPPTAGFGALGPDGRPLADPVLYSQLKYAPSEHASQHSMGGSITSPSDASGAARSAANSPGASSSWDPSSFGLVVERRNTGTSPGLAGGDGYFGAVVHSNVMSHDGTPRTPGYRPGRGVKENLLSERSQGLTSGGPSIRASTPGVGGVGDLTGVAHTPDERTPQHSATQRQISKAAGQVVTGAERGEGSQRHTKLHSYGADFATTFQSLPSGTYVNQTPGREDKVSMLPPSDRLKGLMLDSLPAHVFVALPSTGEIMWVNSRYLSYRGQTVADLIVDPWGSVHPEDRDGYIQKWTHSLRTGEQFAYTVRLRRFDGVYRWHQARAIASKDKRGVIVQFIGSYMDIHDQKIAELVAARQEEIEASEAKHRLLANLIPQIIFAATEEDGITFANEQWLSYTGQSFEDSLGVGFIDFVHPEDLAKCRIPTEKHAARHSETSTPGTKTSAATPTRTGSFVAHQGSLSRKNSSSGSSSSLSSTDLDELARKGIIKVATDSTGRLSYTTELRLRSKSGEYRWHLIRCVEINNINFGTGESSYFGSATDINDHKLLEAKLKEAMESKSRFLSNMSHEIRTPLIGISGMVSFLQDTILNEEQRDYTNTIQTSANSLLMIINDILDLSKVDAGMMKLNFEWFHTRSLIEDVNELVSTMAIAKRLELNYVVEQDVPSWVKGDKVRIRQVLLNVIGNAIKFTSQGEVFSRCKVIQRQDDDEEHSIVLEFSILDTGRGFTKEESDLIFKPFSQIDGSSTRQHGGSGLGLVISRQLVELHGGKMDGSAVPGKGSTFTFTAKFGLPTASDHPGVPYSPPIASVSQTPMEPAAVPPPKAVAPSFLSQKIADLSSRGSPSSEASLVSPELTSSAGSDPSIRSTRSHTTATSSVSSANAGLVHFSEAAKASGQDLSQMKLEMPLAGLSLNDTPTPDLLRFSAKIDQFRPPMYSILIICPQTYSREATTKHIQITLPKDVPHQITALATVEEARKLIGGEESVTFTHIVLNLPSAEEIVRVMERIKASSAGKTAVLVLSDSLQRQAVIKLASENGHPELLGGNFATFIYKPVKPSRFAAVFDPAKLRDLSIDRNRSSAAQMVETTRQSYIDIEKRIGNKGYKVLLVEDNPVNQKVLVRYLKKVGIAAEIANDGVECTEKVFSQPPGFYKLILVCTRSSQHQMVLCVPPCRDIAINVTSSVIFTCLERTAIKLVATFARGRSRTNTPSCQSSPCQPTSCPMSKRNVSRPASATMLRSR